MWSFPRVAESAGFLPHGMIAQIAQFGSCRVRLSLSPEVKGEKIRRYACGFLFLGAYQAERRFCKCCA